MSSSFFGLANATDIGGIKDNPSYLSSQTLYDLSPAQIAGDVEARFDPLTGRTEYVAQDFDPFEGDSTIAGSARLRSASTGISRDGVSIAGGAYLDVSVLYTAATRDPYDSKGLEFPVYISGQPVNVMTYDVQTLDCTRDITRVTYDDSYYRGSYYGYVGGIYRLYPRYRGHSHYYSHRDRIRYGAWRHNNRHGYNGYYHGNRGHNFGGYHGGNYGGHNGRNGNRGNSHGNNNGQGNNNGNGNNNGENGNSNGNNQNLTPEEVRQRIQEREAIWNRELQENRRDHNSVTSRNVVRPDRLGERRLVNPVDTSRRPISSAPPAVQPQRPSRSYSPPSRVVTPNQPTERRLTLPRSSETRSAPSVRSNIPVRAAPSQPAVTPAPNRSSTTRATPSRPPAARTTPSRPSSARSTPSRPSSSSSGRSSSRPATRPSSRSNNSGRSSGRRVDNYYSGETFTQTSVDTRCIKEERLTLHIPAERLEAARFDGLSIAILDRNGNDIPLYVPPNYIEGFGQANPYLRSVPVVRPSFAPAPSVQPAPESYPVQ
ncbi:MAG: hypothetical protein HKN36_08000 [Hellea sp.]|nr:hypothetical protein [Hellea sp.]